MSLKRFSRQAEKWTSVSPWWVDFEMSYVVHRACGVDAGKDACVDAAGGASLSLCLVHLLPPLENLEGGPRRIISGECVRVNVQWYSGTVVQWYTMSKH